MLKSPKKNETLSGELILVDGESFSGRCEFFLNDALTAHINLHSIDEKLYSYLYGLNHGISLIIKTYEYSYLHIYNAFVISGGCKMINIRNSQHASEERVVSLKCYTVLVSDCPDQPKYANDFRFTVTDGNELLGFTVFNTNFSKLIINPCADINIPTKQNIKHINTVIGDISFAAFSEVSFSRNGIHAELNHFITLKSNDDIEITDVYHYLGRITRFFELLCGEIIFITSLRIYADGQEYLCITLDNLKEHLQLFSHEIDNSCFLRRSIFKLSDLSNIENALNIWFEGYNKYILPIETYERILFDAGQRHFATNRFLSAVQIIEGYTNAATDLKTEKDEFEKNRKALISLLHKEHPGFETFANDHLQFSAVKLRKAIKEFMYKGINTLSGTSRSSFFETHDMLFGNIVSDRDYYTHLHNISDPALTPNELNEISDIIVVLFRVIMLSELSFDSQLIYHRLFYNRLTKLLLQRHLDISIKNTDYYAEFDNAMDHFN